MRIKKKFRLDDKKLVLQCPKCGKPITGNLVMHQAKYRLSVHKIEGEACPMSGALTLPNIAPRMRKWWTAVDEYHVRMQGTRWV